MPLSGEMMNVPRAAYVYMLLGAASFSVMSFLTHWLRNTYSWQLIAVVRTGVALVLAILLAKAAGAPLVWLRPGTLWMRSLAGSVALLANFYSMTHYPISEILALSNMFPLWVAVLSWPLLGERPAVDTWIAAALGVAGVFLLQLQPGDATTDTGDSTLPVIMAVVASLASAIAMLGLHHLKGVDARAVVAHFSGVSLVCSGAALLMNPVLTGEEPSTPIALGMLAVLGIAATSGQLFLTKAFAAGPPAKISVVSLSQIAFSILLELTFTNRRFGPTTILGMALVVGPTAWILLQHRLPTPTKLEEEVPPAT